MHTLIPAARSGEYSAVVAQVIPAFLLAAVTVQVRFGKTPPERRRALFDILLSGVTVGVAMLGEFVALFGVEQGGLSMVDEKLLSLLLALIALACLVRIATPLTRQYADATGVPERRVLLWLGIVFAATFVGVTFLIAAAE